MKEIERAIEYLESFRDLSSEDEEIHRFLLNLCIEKSSELQEVWKNVVGYEGLYQVSNRGRVKSLERTVYTHHNNCYKTVQRRILEQTTHSEKHPYKLVSLCKNNIVKTMFVHRLVAEAFIENPKDKPQVNHKDGDKSNNNLLNLEWCTAQENALHAFETGLREFTKSGELSPNAKSKEYYAQKVTQRFAFKRTCERMGWDFEDFEEVYTGVKRKTERYFEYHYKHKPNGGE